MGTEPVERFHPTSGRITGVLGLVLVAAVVVMGLVDRARGFPLPVLAGALLGGVLIWAAMLRPKVWATADELVLRNMLHTDHLPLAAIDRVVVRQVLVVSAGEERYVSPAIGKSRRSSQLAGRPDRRSAAAARVEPSYPDFVAERIAQLAEDARARRGVKLLSDEQLALAAGARRTPAWPEIAALGLAGLLLVASLVL